MNVIIKEYKGYNFGFSEEMKLTDFHFENFIDLFNKPVKPSTKPLEGRATPDFVYIRGLGKVLIKHYIRGGITGKLIKKTYIKLNEARSEAEYRHFINASSLGIKTPNPVLFAFSGNLVYRAWLVMNYIENPRSLIDIIESDEGLSRSLIETVAYYIRKLIGKNIHHVDLHPGNVIIGENNEVYLIDFDKAQICNTKLKEKYLKRWRRAVVKYNLPNFVYDDLEKGLIYAPIL